MYDGLKAVVRTGICNLSPGYCLVLYIVRACKENGTETLSVSVPVVRLNGLLKTRSPEMLVNSEAELWLYSGKHRGVLRGC